MDIHRFKLQYHETRKDMSANNEKGCCASSSSMVRLFFTAVAGILTAQAAIAAGPGMTLIH